MKIDKTTLKESRKAWENLQAFRTRRSRCVEFTQGRQWGDKWKMPDGRIIDEAGRWLESGRIPVTNNLIRRLIKSVIGHYRVLVSGGGSGEREMNLDGMIKTEQGEEKLVSVDSRSLEEFMISGVVCQRVERVEGEMRVKNWSPDEIFFHKFRETDASDCRFLGLLHSMTLTEILCRFGKGDPRRIRQLFEAFGHSESSDTAPLCRTVSDFNRADTADRHRVIEVWSKRSDLVMRVADRTTGKVYTGIFSPEAATNLEEYNRRRKAKNEPELLTGVEAKDTWTEKWLTPEGVVLYERRHLPGTIPPILIQTYPMIDGETRSPVEDLLDQQKYVNRLVMLVDDVLSSTAKGVVLYPTDQLPEGLTWQDLRKIWSSPSGILPFKRTSKNITPQQINSQGSFAGAVDMLQTQLSLFDDIAGLSGASTTRGSASGADMLRQQRENVMISMLDLLIGFRSFTLRRNNLINRL